MANADGSAADPAFAAAVGRAADEAFARVMSGVADQVETMPPGLETADALRWAGDRVTELLAGVAALPLDRWVDRTWSTRGTRSEGADPQVAPAAVVPAGDPITVRTTPGGRAEVRIWVHLVGEGAPSTMRFALTDLVGPAGQTLTGASAEFVPAELPVPCPTPTSVLLRLAVPEQAATGSHVGLVVGVGGSGASVPITVLVG